MAEIYVANYPYQPFLPVPFIAIEVVVKKEYPFPANASPVVAIGQ